MLMNKNLLTSKLHDYETPDSVFNPLNREFNFTLDPCCNAGNRKCKKYFTKKHDGLKQDWARHTVYMNPPYGRQIGKWIKKAYESSLRGATVVCLIPARTDTSYWHDYIFHKAEIRFVRGRIRFLSVGICDKAPFPSAVVIFRPPITCLNS